MIKILDVFVVDKKFRNVYQQFLTENLWAKLSKAHLIKSLTKSFKNNLIISTKHFAFYYLDAVAWARSANISKQQLRENRRK